MVLYEFVCVATEELNGVVLTRESGEKVEGYAEEITFERTDTVKASELTGNNVKLTCSGDE